MAFVLLVGIITYVLTAEYKQVLPEMPLSIPAFLGTSISVLLSFKMNQSYGRWWEARQIWGAIVNDSRSFVIQLQSFLGKEETETVQKLAYRQIAWCYSLGRSLRGQNPLEGVDHLLSPTDVTRVLKHQNRPLGIIQLNAKDIKELRLENHLDTFTHLQLDKTLTRLVASMGKAERINGTVFPSTYRKYLHFIIYIFVITLSISLKDVNVIFELPLLLVIAVGFFLIEKSAYHLQDPFRNRPSDISVTAISRTIEINIRQLLGEEETPEAIKPNDFYIM